MCCVNRGCFIKVGQHIGALDYLLPREYVETFRVLHSDAPQSPISDLAKVFKEETGKEVLPLQVAFDNLFMAASKLGGKYVRDNERMIHVPIHV